MPSEFRPTKPSDGPEVRALAQRLLGVAVDSPMFEERHMRWKYWSAEDDACPRGYVLVRDGAIVAHAGVLPLRYRAPGRSVTLLHPFDWMSEPSAIGSGAALLARLSKLADGLLIVGGSEMTRRMVRPLGFRPLGEVGSYATAAAPTPDALACEAQRIAPAAVVRPEPPASWLDVETPSAWLSACSSCPALPMELYRVSQAGQTLGDLMLAFAPGQARIAAFWPRSGEPSQRAALLSAARQLAAARSGVEEVVCMANAPQDRRALEDAGFGAVGSVPMFVLAPASALEGAAGLAFQMLDGDLAFLHDGQRRPWLPEPT
jgi:hypothetical protein